MLFIPGFALLIPGCVDLLELPLQLEPLRFRARQPPGDIALALQRGDQPFLVALDVRVGAAEPRFKLTLFGLHRLQLGLGVGERELQRLAQIRAALALGGGGAFPRPAVRDDFPRYLVADVGIARASRAHPFAIIVEIAREGSERSVGDQP